MTNAAQAALRRGSSPSQSTLPRRLSSDLWYSTCSHRAVHQERPVLHHLQLRQQDYARDPESVHQVSVQPAAGSGGRKASGGCHRVGEVSRRQRHFNFWRWEGKADLRFVSFGKGQPTPFWSGGIVEAVKGRHATSTQRPSGPFTVPPSRLASIVLTHSDTLGSFQACHAAFDVVDETAVYACTGNPHPQDIEKVINSMMSQEFTTSFNCTFSYMPRRARTCTDTLCSGVGMQPRSRPSAQGRQGTRTAGPRSRSLRLYRYAGTHAGSKDLPP